FFAQSADIFAERTEPGLPDAFALDEQRRAHLDGDAARSLDQRGGTRGSLSNFGHTGASNRVLSGRQREELYPVLTCWSLLVSLKGLTEQHHDHGPEQRIDPHDLASWPLLFCLVYGPVCLRAAGD